MSKQNVKFTCEEVSKIVESKACEWIDGEYINCFSKLTIRDGDGYLYHKTLADFMRYKPYFVKRTNKYTIQNIKHWIKLNNKPIELLSEAYVDNTSKLKWKCLKDGCGETFEQTWDLVLRGGLCLFCSGKLISKVNSLESLMPEIAKEWHPTKNGQLKASQITCGNNSINVWWLCSNNPKHEWQSYVGTRTSKQSKCPFCIGRLASDEYNLLQNNPKLCEEWDYDKNDKLPSEYTPFSNQKVFWRCDKCDHSWSAAINMRNGRNRGCPKCNTSRGENQIEVFLNLYNIANAPQKEFDGLVGLGNGNLSYDFYLSKYNLLIEFQGEYHSEKRHKHHDFEKQQEHDRRKREYAKDNNINLLEIWHYDFDKIEEILIKELNLDVSKTNDAETSVIFNK